MKLITFLINGNERIGIINRDNATVSDITDKFCDMNTLLESGCSPEELYSLQHDSSELKLDGLTLLAPVPRPRQDIICLGINYMEHAAESAKFKKEAFDGKREYPVYFSKRVNEAVPDNGVSHCSDADDKIDYEAELGLIIGRKCRSVSAAESEKYIFGYTVINDLSARSLQNRHKQWYYGKSFDGSCPMGPWIVTADEIPYPPKLKIESRVNSEIRQSSDTGKLIFAPAYIIEDLSRSMTLLPGTIISTGTPAGAGMGFDPPRFLKKGDKVVCSIEKIGTLTTYIE